MRRQNRKLETMAISEQELTLMTSDLEQINNDVGMPAMRQAVGEWTEKSRSSPRSTWGSASRRVTTR